MANKTSRVTLQQIADEVGIAKSSVSMILNGNSKAFSADTKKQVHLVAQRLGYKTSSLPVSGSEFLNKTIAVICPNMYNPYYTTLVQSIEKTSKDTGMNIIVFNTYRSQSQEIDILNMALDCNLAGIIFTWTPAGEELIRLIERIYKRVPVVIIGDLEKPIDVDTVAINYYNSGALLAEHLISLGHRHIAFISTTLEQDNVNKRQRLNGIQDIFSDLKEDHTVLVESMSVTSNESLEGMQVEFGVGKTLTERCLDNKDITAFIGVNDMVAYGIQEALLEKGFRIPEDYSVCGCDNIFASKFQGVSLTTIEHGVDQKGKLAFEVLMNERNRRFNTDYVSNELVTRIEYKSKLLIRHSTGKPRE